MERLGRKRQKRDEKAQAKGQAEADVARARQSVTEASNAAARRQAELAQYESALRACLLAASLQLCSLRPPLGRQIGGPCMDIAVLVAPAVVRAPYTGPCTTLAAMHARPARGVSWHSNHTHRTRMVYSLRCLQEP